MADPATVTVCVFIRDVIVHHDRDPGPGAGEYDVTFVAAASPSLAAESARAGARWTGSVSDGKTYPVRLWTEAVTVPTSHSLAVVGAGEERDAVRSDPLQGGLSIFAAAERWGDGRWWRTTNGTDFDFLFFVARVEEGTTPQGGDEPTWMSLSEDAPGPQHPTPNEYAVAFGAPIRND